MSRVHLRLRGAAFLSDIACAKGGPSRNLVVLYLGGGNDSLSTLMPYNDRSTAAGGRRSRVPPANVLQIGRDSRGALGLHPRLTGLRRSSTTAVWRSIQRTGYANSSRSHFSAPTSGRTAIHVAAGSRMARPLSRAMPSPVDPLVGLEPRRETPRPLLARRSASRRSNPAYAFSSPNGGAEARSRACDADSSHLPVDRPHLAFVNSTRKRRWPRSIGVAPVATYARR